jgi:nucleoside-diphosphate-sugar epimerase
VQNLLQLLDWSKLKRFVQVGSSDEYGNHPPPQHEKMRELPISPYSLGKVASTQFLQMLHRTQDFPAVIVRLFLTYGPGQDNKRFFPATIQGCLSGDPFPTTAGEQLRDFCYVDDIAEGILATLTNEQVNGEIINLASGNPVTIRDATELIQKTLGRGAPEFGKIPYRVGENMALYADVYKAKRILDWKPLVTFEEGVERTIDEYLARTQS